MLEPRRRLGVRCRIRRRFTPSGGARGSPCRCCGRSNRAEPPDGIQYSQFCERSRAFRQGVDGVMRQSTALARSCSPTSPSTPASSSCRRGCAGLATRPKPRPAPEWGNRGSPSRSSSTGPSPRSATAPSSSLAELNRAPSPNCLHGSTRAPSTSSPARGAAPSSPSTVRRCVHSPPSPTSSPSGRRFRVHVDSHIELDRHDSSVSHPLAGRQLLARFTAHTVELLDRGQRVASHRRFHHPGRHPAVPEHMPEPHRRFAQPGSSDRFSRRAHHRHPPRPATPRAQLPRLHRHPAPSQDRLLPPTRSRRTARSHLRLPFGALHRVHPPIQTLGGRHGASSKAACARCPTGWRTASTRISRCR